MSFYLPDDVQAGVVADLHHMPERVIASGADTLGFLHALLTARYAIERDAEDADGALARINSFEQAEALSSDMITGPIGEAAMRVLIRHRDEMVTAIRPWLAFELRGKEAASPRAVGRATMTVLNRWMDRNWSILVSEIAAESRGHDPTATP